MKIKFKHIIYTAILSIIGILLFKILPMRLFGENILFDASRHLITLSFGLYFLYYLFIQYRESWKLSYIIFSSMILGVVAVQRIIAGEHDEYGVLLGFAVSAFSIFAPLMLEEKFK